MEVFLLAFAAEVVVEFHVDIAHGLGCGLFGGFFQRCLHGGLGILLQILLGDFQGDRGGGDLDGDDVARGFPGQRAVTAVADVRDQMPLTL